MTGPAPNAPETPSIRPQPGENPYILEADWTLDPVPCAARWSADLQLYLDDRDREGIPIGGPATTADDISDKGLIVVPAGFEFNGASIPEDFEGVIGYEQGDRRLDIPSLAHDWLYTNHQAERHQADDLFYYLPRQAVHDISRDTAFSMWDAVTQLGGSRYPNEPDHIAPVAALCANLVGQGAEIEKYCFPEEVRRACDCWEQKTGGA